MRVFLQLLSLSDRYERKTQLLPGMIAASPLSVVIVTSGRALMTWQGAAGTAAGAEALLAFLLGYLARARGRAAETAMWRTWGGPPTTRWLRPSDATCSDQQKTRWRGVIHRVTGLRIPASVADGRTEADIDRVAADAVRQLRNAIRNKPVGAMAQVHNEDYGLARSLYGLRWHWVGVAILALAACAALFAAGEKPFLGLGASMISLAMALLVGRQLPDQIRWCADRYAESLFSAATLHDDEVGRQAAMASSAEQ